jgi:mono/diheme cytochrome c family protein
LTDQQVKDAFRKGTAPRAPGKYLFSNMPWYQFANLSDSDADAIVAYLRSLKPVMHKVPDNTGTYATRASAPDWKPLAATDMPAASAAAPAGAANGKYLASLMCVTCHTVEMMNAMPRQLDTTKVLQGGRTANTVMGVMKMIQSSNLTPDDTGLKGWTAAQIATLLKTGKDPMGQMICTPMRMYPNLMDSDAMDIGSYLVSIPPVKNMLTATCH